MPSPPRKCSPINSSLVLTRLNMLECHHPRILSNSTILTFRSKFCSFSSWTNTKVKCEWLTIRRKFGTVKFSITSTQACKKDSTSASGAVLSTTLETRATKGLLGWDLGQISRDFPSPAFWLKTWCLMKWAPKTSSRSSNWLKLKLLCTQWWSRGSRTRICRTSQSAI